MTTDIEMEKAIARIVQARTAVVLAEREYKKAQGSRSRAIQELNAAQHALGKATDERARLQQERWEAEEQARARACGAWPPPDPGTKR